MVVKVKQLVQFCPGQKTDHKGNSTGPMDMVPALVTAVHSQYEPLQAGRIDLATKDNPKNIIKNVPYFEEEPNKENYPNGFPGAWALRHA